MMQMKVMMIKYIKVMYNISRVKIYCCNYNYSEIKKNTAKQTTTITLNVDHEPLDLKHVLG